MNRGEHTSDRHRHEPLFAYAHQGTTSQRETRLREVLAAVREFHRLIMHENDPRRLLSRACDTLTGSLGYRKAWIAVTEGASEGPRLVATSGFGPNEDAFRQAIEKGDGPIDIREVLEAEDAIIWVPRERCAACTRTDVCSDGISLIRRVNGNEKTTAVLGVCLSQSSPCPGEEQEALEEFSEELALAIERIERLSTAEESRQRYQEIFEAGRDGYVMVDPSERILDANRAFCDMVGYSLEELRNMPSFMEITPKRWHDWERQEIWDERLLTHGYSGVFEKEYIRKDSTVFPAELQAHAVFDVHGRPIYLWAIIRDITQQKKSLEALRESEQRFRTIYEWLPIGVAQVSLDFRVERANAAYCRMLGYEESELIGKHLRDFTHPDALEENLRKQKRLARGEIDRYQMEKTFVHKDGHTVYGLLGANLIRDAFDSPAYFLGTVVDVTEQKLADRALRRSEAKFRGYIENSPDPIFVADHNGRFQEANPAACELLGYSVDELTSRSIPDIVAPEEAQSAKAGLAQVREQGYVSSERALLGKEGNRIKVALDAARLPDGRIIAFCKDITQRNRAEEALRVSEHRFRTVVENASDIVFSVSLEGVVIYLSPRWEDCVGIPAAECIGKRFEVYVHPDDVPTCREALAELGQGHSLDAVEYRVRAADGRWRKHVANVSPLFDENRSVVSVVGIAQDVTEREQAARELRETREVLETAVAQSPSGIVIADAPRGTIRMANPAAFGIRGGDPRVLTGIEIGRHAARWNIFRPDGTPYPSELLPLSRAVLNGETTQGEEIIIRDESGADHWVSANAAPIRDSDGNLVAGMVIFHEISEHKRIEREKAQLEEQFRQSQKMEAIGQLTGGVAHDFNNLLMVINGYTELASHKLPEDHAACEWLAQVSEAGNRAARLVEQLLLFSRRQIMQLEELDFNQVLSGVLSMLERVIGEDIHLEFNPEPELATVCADRGMIEQILMNLGINARDAMPGGGNLVIETKNTTVDEPLLRTDRALSPGPYVLLQVSDTGCGIETEALEHIFEPFFTTKEVGKGTGLGLATVYGIVQQHKGAIRVESRRGIGTTFRVYLPAVEGSAAPSDLEKSPAAVGGTETILLAEDNEMVRDYTVEMLQAEGYTLLTAHDGEEAVELFARRGDEIDLLLFDIVMPRMGGEEAWQRIHEIRPDVPVLFASGYSETVFQANFIQKEGLTLMQKPFKRDELLRQIREMLAKKGSKVRD